MSGWLSLLASAAFVMDLHPYMFDGVNVIDVYVGWGGHDLPAWMNETTGLAVYQVVAL